MRLLLFLTVICSLRAAAVAPPDKILTVKVDEYGIIRVGRDTVSADELARYIQERLFKSYMGTGQMHDRIRFEKEAPAVSGIVTDVVIREIRIGQEKALRELCLQKYRRTWEMLDSKKKSRLRKLFPVLFQEEFSQNV